ncbi:MAG: FAD-binding oxidoreductase [Kiritimatiellia bacterium]
MHTESGSFNMKEEYREYLRDESRLSGRADSIAFPRSEDELRARLAGAHHDGERVTVQGARTGITGGAVPRGGRVLNLSRMKNIAVPPREQNQEAFLKVQPGALLEEVRAATEFFFPPDPTETTASLGGMTACDASGARSLFYGSTRAYIQRLRLVLADGSVLDLKRGEQKAKGRAFSLATEDGRTVSGSLPRYSMPAVKNAAGYFVKDDMDMLDLFCGSEGTLGVISEIELRLIPPPRAVWGVMVFLPTESQAVEFVNLCRGLNTRQSALEFFDSHSLELLRRQKKENPAFSDLQEPPDDAGTAVYAEYHGPDDEAVEESVMEMSGVIDRCGGNEDATWLASGPADMEKMKYFRHAVPEAVNLTIDRLKQKNPDLTKLGTDFAVPDDSLDEALNMYLEDLKNARLDYVIFGHIGDNHVHVNIIPDSMEKYSLGKELYLQWAQKIAALGGTVSGEHGIGKLKTDLLEIMYGKDAVQEMKQLKNIFDPENMLNVGNLF